MAKKNNHHTSKKDKMLEYIQIYPNTIIDDEYLINEYLENNNLDKVKTLNDSADYIENILKNRKERKIKITLFEFPTPTKRVKVFRFGAHVFGAKEAKDRFVEYVSNCFNLVTRFINTPMRTRIEFHLPMPKGLSPKEVIAYQARTLDVASKPDQDNLTKYYQDMMNEVIYLDDDLVHSSDIRKFYNLRPRVVVELIYLEKHESKYVFNKIRKRKLMKKMLAEGTATIELLKGA